MIRDLLQDLWFFMNEVGLLNSLMLLYRLTHVAYLISQNDINAAMEHVKELIDCIFTLGITLFVKVIIEMKNKKHIDKNP